jgi:hypothetical protein
MPSFNPDFYPAMDWESDAESDGDACSAMDISSGSSATSYSADSMRSVSPVSVISINSSMQFWKNEHGRLINTYSDVYQLPADAEEFERLSTSG